MLARLGAEPYVERAEVDLHGALLRVQLSDTADLTTLLAILEQLGFPAALADDDIGQRSWYGADRVGELSRAEGRIIAERVISSFAREHGVDSAAASVLFDSVAQALYRCFTSPERDPSAPASVVRSECALAAQRAAAPVLGPDLAATLGAAIAADLESHSTGGGHVE